MTAGHEAGVTSNGHNGTRKGSMATVKEGTELAFMGTAFDNVQLHLTLL